MLNSHQKAKVTTLVDAKTIAQEEFTAFDITKVLRKTEPVTHRDVKEFVHNYMRTGELSTNDYRKELYNDPQGWQAWKYIPNLSDEDDCEDDCDCDCCHDSDVHCCDIDEDEDDSGTNKTQLIQDAFDILNNIKNAALKGIKGVMDDMNKKVTNTDSDDSMDDTSVGNILIKLDAKGRITLSKKYFGSTLYPELYVYVDNDSKLVVTAGDVTGSANNVRVVKFDTNRNGYRFTVPTYIGYTALKLQKITDDFGISLYFDFI